MLAERINISNTRIKHENKAYAYKKVAAYYCAATHAIWI